MLRVVMAAFLFASSSASSGCAFAIGKYVIAPFDDSDAPDREIMENVQRENAVHEAAHAIATAILFSVEEVQEIVVNTKVDDDGYIGFMRLTPEIERRFREADVFNDAVSDYAGRAADILISGGATSGANADLRNAQKEIWSAYIRYGLKGSPLVYKNPASAPDEMRKKVEREILEAELLTTKIVAANEATIRALADEIMAIKPWWGRRVMKADAFREFCETHRLIDPRPTKKPDTAE